MSFFEVTVFNMYDVVGLLSFMSPFEVTVFNMYNVVVTQVIQ